MSILKNAFKEFNYLLGLSLGKTTFFTEHFDYLPSLLRVFTLIDSVEKNFPIIPLTSLPIQLNPCTSLTLPFSISTEQ